MLSRLFTIIDQSTLKSGDAFNPSIHFNILWYISIIVCLYFVLLFELQYFGLSSQFYWPLGSWSASYLIDLYLRGAHFFKCVGSMESTHFKKGLLFTQGDYDQTSLKSCYTLHGPGLQICSSDRIWLVIVVKATQIRTLLTQVSCSAAPLLLTVPNMLFVSLASTTTLAQDGKSCHTLHHLESGVQLSKKKGTLS